MNNEKINIKEPFEDYFSLLNKIDKMGPIKNIVTNKKILKDIIAYSGDRHLLAALFEKISYAIQKKELKDIDLCLLRSDWLVNQIINLNFLARRRKRKLYKFEMGDKLNYLTLIKDFDILNSSFTSDKLIKSIINNPEDTELRYWIDSGSIYMNLPIDIQINVAKKFIDLGAKNYGLQLLKTIRNTQERFIKLTKEEKKL